MKRVEQLMDDEKWTAVVHCDRDYDGLFFYGVKTTRIFCRPSCSSKTPRRENTVYFAGAAEAKEAGFRPCMKCNPCAEHDIDTERVQKAAARFDERYADAHIVNDTITELGMSKSHFIRLFKQQNGCTPNRYLMRLRITRAAYLLRESDQTILQTALSCGFESASHFYKCFKEQTGVTPARYKALHRKKKEK